MQKIRYLGYCLVALVRLKLVKRDGYEKWLNDLGHVMMGAWSKAGKTLIASLNCPPYPEPWIPGLALRLEKANLRLVRLEHLVNSYHKPSHWCPAKKLAFITFQ